MIEQNAAFSHHKVLFVDDEINLLRSIARALHDESFGQEYYDSPRKALIALQQQRFTVVVSDLKMPELSGLDFLTLVKRDHPKLVRIIATGVTDLSEVLTAMRSGETHRYISKPINISEELLPTLQQSFEWYDMHRTQERLTEELIELSTYLQHQKEEIAFFKDLSERSNLRKEELLVRINTLLPDLFRILYRTLPLIDAGSPKVFQELAELLGRNREAFDALRTDLAEALITLECQPGDPI